MSNDRLWAPWRLAYIKGLSPEPASQESLPFLTGADPDCFFCRDVVDDQDRANLVVHRGPRTITLLNRYPYNNGHLLVAPREHLGRLDQLDEATQLESVAMLTRLVGLLEKLLSADGFNVGLNLGRVAGAGVPGHLHWHIVPRWNGDTNFMPVVGDAKVISQSLEALWELLVPALQTIPNEIVPDDAAPDALLVMDPSFTNPVLDATGLAAREQLLLAPYAMHSTDSAGRKHAEPPHPYRAPFQRDRDRIVHSAAYRRLSSKTQVFTGEMGDYHRTRLTHTLEVASIARTLGRALRLNEDLVEALALAHDLGHPPYGHAGEDVLDECLREERGFSHNRQALRIMEQLEQRYPDFPGLNLSIELLEGQATRIDHAAAGSQPLMEVQVVEAADSIAYDTHDADDALELKVLELAELIELPLWREALARVRRRYTALEGPELKRALLHELIDWQAGDLLLRASRRIVELELQSVADVRAAAPVITADPELHQQKIELERFLREHVYRHPQLLELRSQAQEQLRAMFAGYLARPELLPPRFQTRVAAEGLQRSVADYLAGMTDRYAQQEYRRLFA